MKTTTRFVSGDVMTGRGLDQAMHHPGSPTLQEPSVRDARRHVELAEAAHGRIVSPINPRSLWGDALAVLRERSPVARSVNLETSITTCSEWCRAKEVHYRGFDVPEDFILFARRLIEGGVDLIHGHSSHHVRLIEVSRDRLILCGCGDLLDDYEGIIGHGRYRGDQGIMYFPMLQATTGRLLGLDMVPMQMRRFRLSHAVDDGMVWLRDTLGRISRSFGCAVEMACPGVVSLRW